MNTIVIFAKAPVPGKVKTRLCPPLTHRQAAELYRAFARDTIELARRVPDSRSIVTYEPLGGPPLDWLGEVPSFIQEGADLGARIEQAFTRAFSAGASKALVIGTDTPHLSPQTITRAFKSLESHDAVIGPASDGGYYLLGLTRLHAGLFKGIPWSTGQVFEKTVALMKESSLSVDQLETVTDIDNPKDLEILSRFRPPEGEPGPIHSQRALKPLLPVTRQS